jgi:hypothetical protein
MQGATLESLANQIRLTTFFERSFFPTHLAGPTARPRLFREAIAWLDQSLGRPATLADLADAHALANVRQTIRRRRWLRKFHGVRGETVSPQHRARDVRERLRAIAQHAQGLGLLPPDEKPAPRPKPEKPLPEFLQSAPGPDTLAAAFEKLRSRLGRNRSRKTVTSYGTAVRQFDEMLSRYSTPADVTPRELARFRESIVGRGRSESLYMLYAARLRTLARAIAPDRFPAATVPMPMAAAGTVRRFYERTYVPERLTGCSARSHADYARTFRKLYQFHGRDPRLAELSDKLAADFFNWLLARGVRAVTVNSHRARLFSIWRLAADRGLVDAAPKVRKLAEALDAPDCWTESETRRIMPAGTTCDRGWFLIPLMDVMLCGQLGSFPCQRPCTIAARGLSLDFPPIETVGQLRDVYAELTGQTLGSRGSPRMSGLPGVRQVSHA